MGRFYHVTSCRNLKSIEEYGLEPQYGFLSEMMMEERSAVYLFKDLDEVVYAMNNWMNYITHVYYKEDLILLQIDLPDDFRLIERHGWEAISYKTIPWECISVIDFPDLDKGKTEHSTESNNSINEQ